MQKVTPFLWFDDNAEEAVNHYVSVFEDSEILHMQRMGGPDGKVVTGSFRIGEQRFMVLNGGSYYKLNPSFSILIDCKDQAEVDELWDKLGEGGEPGRCGWLVDRFGLSWQVIPRALGQLLGDPDPEKSGRVMQAMLQMNKIDVAALEAAHAG